LSTKFAVRLAGWVLAASVFSSLCSIPSSAQQAATPDASAQTSGQAPASGQTTAQTAPSTQQAPADKPAGTDTGSQTKSGHSPQAGTSNDRLFYALPNFLTLENAGHVPPLTVGGKFKVVARGTFDYVQIPWYAFLSGISQWEDSEPGLGQGAAGFGKRYATAFADGSIENFVTSAILPSILRQDPRYFQLGHGSIMHRTWYAVTRNLVTLSDSGKSQFNYSEVFGGAIAGAISTYSYHPRSHLVTTTTPGVLRYIPSDRTLTNTGKVWGTQFGYDALTLIVKEFWPDVRRKVNKHRQARAAAKAAPSGP